MDADVIKLLPAEWRVSSEPIALATVLGSCVAACLYDASAKVGGMNHFMLPDAAPGDGSARYGAHAMELLINGLLKHGAVRSRLQAKVFGGGNVLPGMTLDPIGTRNGNFVLNYLSAERIPIVAQDLFGVQPRKVCFFVRTGRTLVKRLPAAGEIARVERAYRSQLAQKPVAGSVELF
ncbi:MAG: chemotaxis protein CheD [Lysobacteraceae bacterium SCN 69-48]|nr:MAG: chemotaxis protein CheD [Xanthomonadaceae bacterium SCN 69-48]